MKALIKIPGTRLVRMPPTRSRPWLPNGQGLAGLGQLNGAGLRGSLVSTCEDDYQTPKDYIDLPFAYVFDGTGLTNGTSPQNLAVRVIFEGDFLLRRIVGVPLVASQIQLRNPGGQSYMSRVPITASNNQTILPEKIYQFGSNIVFDLYSVLKAANVCERDANVLTSYFAFMGVRRVYDDNPQGPVSYWERPFVYGGTSTAEDVLGINPVTVSWFAGATRSLYVPIKNFGFELRAIAIRHSDGTALTGDEFALTIYDSGKNQLSSAPLNNRFIDWNAGVSFGSVFPFVPVFYPVNSILQIDLTSFLCASGGNKAYNIDLHGVERVPC